MTAITPLLAAADASDPGDDNHWLTRTPRPSLGAAPWERGTSSESEDSAGAKPTGNHTDGVTVADLIAKVTGTEPASAPARHRAEPEAEPDPPPARFVEPVDAEEHRPPARDPDTQDTEVIPVVSAYASELPDLSPERGQGTAVTHRRRWWPRHRSNRTMAAAG